MTPLMQQYQAIKEQYRDALLLFQVGDFYELFFEDAQKAAACLGITLTKRGHHEGEPIPLCGVPVHTVHHYLRKLVQAGFYVALCDQLSAPQPGKMVERGVVQLLSPATLTDATMLDDKKSSYLACVSVVEGAYGLLFIEYLTLTVRMTQLPADTSLLAAELARFLPDEILIDPATPASLQQEISKWGYIVKPIMVTARSDEAQEQVRTRAYAAIARSIEGQQAAALRSAELVTTYFALHHPKALEQGFTATWYVPSECLHIDAASQSHLELVKNTKDGGRDFTLFSVLDKAITAMGSRLIRSWLLRPLADYDEIVRRHAAVGCLVEAVQLRGYVEEMLCVVSDVERIVGRLSLQRATHHDLVALQRSLQVVDALCFVQSQLREQPALGRFVAHADVCRKIAFWLESALSSEPDQPYLIRVGYDPELDRLRMLATDGARLLAEFELNEQQATGINGLKVRLHASMGYAIELTKAQAVHAPAHYKCVQTLVNKQRFVTLQLLSLAHEVTSAQTAADEREKQLYQELLVRITEQIPALRAYAHTLATLDAWYGLAQAALAHGYVRPVMHTQSDIQITKGRHAVIEALQRSRFIPNDVSLTDREKLWLITGPNMAGKSTFLRQIALICIMAQAGSFVPAEAASLPVLDKLFTRIGASDNVAGGKSTFFVEMEEVATICAQATPQSLVILDEVGRGTSAQEGLVIAQALVEYLYDTIQARTLFATHYHELARLVHDRPAIACYQAASAEKGDSVIFFHTIIPGVAHSSRGIETAALAGVPSSVLKRAQQLLLEYGQQDHVNGLKRVVQQAVVVCTDCPQSREVIEQLKSIELDDMTPRQAYDLVAQLQRKSKSL